MSSRASTDVGQPRYFYIQAKAGSGKTEYLACAYIALLTARLAEIETRKAERGSLLSEILALTFTNEATHELRKRILHLLKAGARGENGVLARISDAWHMLYEYKPPFEKLQGLCDEAISEILIRYSQFGVVTLDRFLIRLILATLPQHGPFPNPEILLTSHKLERMALELLESRYSSELSRMFPILHRYLQDIYSRNLWDPLSFIFREGKESLTFLASYPPRISFGEERLVYDPGEKLPGIIQRINELIELERQYEERIRELFRKIEGILPRDALNQPFQKLLQDITLKRLPLREIIKKRNLNQRMVNVKYPSQERIRKAEDLRSQALATVQKYIENSSLLGFYSSFIFGFLLRQAFRDLFLEQGKSLLSYAEQWFAQDLEEWGGIPPLLYFRLGGKIRFLLLDEFQDTAPIQWYLLRPLVHEILAGGGGSGILFVVGDTRQSLYSFRGSDWRLMSALRPPDSPERTPLFPTATPVRQELRYNFRSSPAILRYVKEVFHKNRFEALLKRIIAGEKKEVLGDENQLASLFQLWIEEAGLTDVDQDLPPSASFREGRVELYTFAHRSGDDESESRSSEEEVGGEARDEGPTSLLTPFSSLLERILCHLLYERQCTPGEIAILCERNADVVYVSSLLKELQRRGVLPSTLKILSFSTLDLRLNPWVEEIFHLLRYLHALPGDEDREGFLANFLLGEIFFRFLILPQNRDLLPEVLKQEEKISREVFFTWFQKEWNKERKKPYSSLTFFLKGALPRIWDKTFAALENRQGFMSTYELVSEIYRRFSIAETFFTPKEESPSDDPEKPSPLLAPAIFLGLLDKLYTFEKQRGMDMEALFQSYLEGEEDFWDLEAGRSDDAIAVMTIHKAKGKEFPLVIYAHFPYSPSHQRGLKRDFWFRWLPPPDERDPTLTPSFLINPQEEWRTQVYPVGKEVALYIPRFWQARAEKRAQELLDQLTRLYVALTRSKEELYILWGINPKTRTERGSFDQAILEHLLLPSDFCWSKKYAQSLLVFGDSWTQSLKTSPLHAKVREKGGTHTPEILKKLFPLRSPRLPAAPVDTPEIRLGTRIHEILSRISFRVPDWDGELMKQLHEQEIPWELSQLLLRQVTRGFTEGIIPPAREIMEEEKEQEIADSSGNLYRIDRLLIYPGLCILLDFKTGLIRREDHHQVQSYLRLLSAIHPEVEIKGFLVHLLHNEEWLEVK